eukprot:11622356-Prorocentrum_lima.AAC.1
MSEQDWQLNYERLARVFERQTQELLDLRVEVRRKQEAIQRFNFQLNESHISIQILRREIAQLER